jgi:hypothetical protein
MAFDYMSDSYLDAKDELVQSLVTWPSEGIDPKGRQDLGCDGMS